MNVNLIKHSVLSALTFVSATCASAKEELPYYEYPKDVTAVEDNTLFDYPVKMLYTPLATYKKEGSPTITLIGTTHIADGHYYRSLQKKLASYDAVFYEMLTSKETKDLLTSKKPLPCGATHENCTQKLLVDSKPNTSSENPLPSPKKEASLLTVTGNAFLAQMPKLLHDVQFSTQNHTLLYHAPNFVHADLTMEDVTELLKKQPSVKTEQDAILSENMKTMLNAYAAKDYCTVRKCLITFIHESPRTLKNQKILIDARNKRCWSVMKDHFKENSPKNVAVLYGIMHLPNFHDILIKEGYVLDDTVWRRAMHSNVPDYGRMEFEYRRKNRYDKPDGPAFLIRKP